MVSESGSGWAELVLCFFEGGDSRGLYALLKQKLTVAALGKIRLVTMSERACVGGGEGVSFLI